LKDTGGLEIKFGSVEAMLKLLELIAKREGIGDLLAEGTAVAAKKIGKGAVEYAMNVKGLEMLCTTAPEGGFGAFGLYGCNGPELSGPTMLVINLHHEPVFVMNGR